MPLKRSIALVGMPGSGKSTAGRLLAKRFGVVFSDTDAWVEEKAQCSIAELFSKQGEKTFRDLEQEALTRVCSGAPKVIATGGGAILRDANREILRRACVVLYLRANAEELVRRLAKDESRPLLAGTDVSASLRRLFQEREPLYRKTAHYIVETGRPSIHAMINRMAMQLELAGWGESEATEF
jgi:shikimate kinase